MPVRGHVLFPGRVPYQDAPALLAIGNVAVAPKQSLTESNGKLFNYMAMELPVVAIDTPANRAIVGNLGHLVQPDAGALARAIECALEDTTEARLCLRRRIVDCFSWAERVLDLEAVYGRVLQPRRRRQSDALQRQVLLGESKDDKR